MSSENNCKENDENSPLFYDKTSSPKAIISTYIILSLTVLFILIPCFGAIIKFFLFIHDGYQYIVIAIQVVMFSNVLLFTFIGQKLGILPKEFIWYFLMLCCLTMILSLSTLVIIIIN